MCQSTGHASKDNDVPHAAAAKLHPPFGCARKDTFVRQLNGRAKQNYGQVKTDNAALSKRRIGDSQVRQQEHGMSPGVLQTGIQKASRHVLRQQRSRVEYNRIVQSSEQ